MFGGMMRQEGEDCTSKALVHLILGSPLIYYVRAKKVQRVLDMLYNVCETAKPEDLGNEVTTAIFLPVKSPTKLSWDNIKTMFKRFSQREFMDAGIIYVGPLYSGKERVEHAMAYVGGHLVDSNFSKEHGLYDEELVQQYIYKGCKYFKMCVVHLDGPKKDIPWKLIHQYMEMRGILERLS